MLCSSSSQLLSASPTHFLSPSSNRFLTAHSSLVCSLKPPVDLYLTMVDCGHLNQFMAQSFFIFCIVVILFLGWSHHTQLSRHSISSKPGAVFQTTSLKISCARHMTAGAGDSNDPDKINLDGIRDMAKYVWDSFPQPVKIFPWNRALDNFVQLALDLILAVVKYISVPLMMVTSLSEMSYCAHERKLFLVPFPLLVGFTIAGVLRDTALELSPLLKDAEVPWHLIAIAVLFTLLKLPGPYYPYWGRIFIPHLANGGLFRTLWSAFFWFWRPPKALDTKMPLNSPKNTDSKQDKV